MRVGITVNMGQYESVRFDSSDFPTIEQCLLDLVAEIKKEVMGKDALRRVGLYLTNIFGPKWW